MKRILILSPISIAGSLIMESFAKGFEQCGCFVKIKEVEKLSKEDVKDFRPDMIMGYDYSYLMNDNCRWLVDEIDCKNHVFYFADEPQSKFAHTGRHELYQELKKIDATVFIWDKDFVNEFENCHYLPLAVVPSDYDVDFVGYKYTMSFVGRPITEKRLNFLCDLIKVYKNKLSIFCYEKHFLQSLEMIKEKNLLDDGDFEIYSKCWKGFIQKRKELAKIYRASKINLNITEQGSSSLNYRVFEVLASGGFLLTDEVSDLSNFFEVSKHLETYSDLSDLCDKIDFYLNNINIAQKMASLGHLQCIKKHTFSARAKGILAQVF